MITSNLRNKVFERDNYTCMYCGASGDNISLEIDHIIPVSKGGIDNINNLVTACSTCNNKKRAKILSVDNLQVLAEKINSSLDFLLGLIGEKRNTNKISIYVKNEELLKRIKFFALLNDMSLTEFTEKLYSEYAEKHKNELANFLQGTHEL